MLGPELRKYVNIIITFIKQVKKYCIPGTNSGHVRRVAAHPWVGDDLGGLQAAGAGVDLVLGQGEVAQTLVTPRCRRPRPCVPGPLAPQPLGGPHAGPGERRDVGVLTKYGI